MPSMKRALVLLLATSASACAAVSAANKPAGPDQFKLADGTLVACRMERPTGSNIPERVCERVEGTSAAQKQANAEIMQRPAVQPLKGN